MLRTAVYFLILMITGACGVNAQKEGSPNSLAEEQLIRQTIEMYFEGWRTGDTLKLGTAMHSTCKLKNIKEDEVVVYDRAKYLSFFKPRVPVDAKTRIVSINITRDIAAAKCEIELPNRLFTDYFNLMKVDGRWYIVDKIATNWQIK